MSLIQQLAATTNVKRSEVLIVFTLLHMLHVLEVEKLCRVKSYVSLRVGWTSLNVEWRREREPLPCPSPRYLWRLLCSEFCTRLASVWLSKLTQLSEQVLAQHHPVICPLYIYINTLEVWSGFESSRRICLLLACLQSILSRTSQHIVLSLISGLRHSLAQLHQLLPRLWV